MSGSIPNGSEAHRRLQHASGVCYTRAREATAGLLATLVHSKDGEYQ